MKISAKTTFTAALLLAGGLALTGCGGPAASPATDGASSSESAKQAAPSGPLTEDNFIDRISAAQLDAGTVHLSMDMGDSVEGSVESDQEFSTDPQKTRMHMTMSASGVDSEIILVDGKLFMNLGAMSQNKFIDMSADPASAASVDAMIDQVNPETQLAGFRAALTEFVANPSTTTIDGVETTQLTLTLDTKRMFEASMPEDMPVDSLIETLGESVVYEMFIGPDDLPRRIVMPNTAGLGTATQEYTKWGEPVSIEAPAADQIIDPAKLQG